MIALTKSTLKSENYTFHVPVVKEEMFLCYNTILNCSYVEVFYGHIK